MQCPVFTSSHPPPRLKALIALIGPPDGFFKGLRKKTSKWLCCNFFFSPSRKKHVQGLSSVGRGQNEATEDAPAKSVLKKAAYNGRPLSLGSLAEGCSYAIITKKISHPVCLLYLNQSRRFDYSLQMSFLHPFGARTSSVPH